MTFQTEIVASADRESMVIPNPGERVVPLPKARGAHVLWKAGAVVGGELVEIRGHPTGPQHEDVAGAEYHPLLLGGKIDGLDRDGLSRAVVQAAPVPSKMSFYIDEHAAPTMARSAKRLMPRRGLWPVTASSGVRL